MKKVLLTLTTALLSQSVFAAKTVQKNSILDTFLEIVNPYQETSAVNCFSRTYSDEHMKNNPLQTVKSLTLLARVAVSTNEQGDDLGFRNYHLLIEGTKKNGEHFETIFVTVPDTNSVEQNKFMPDDEYAASGKVPNKVEVLSSTSKNSIVLRNHGVDVFTDYANPASGISQISRVKGGDTEFRLDVADFSQCMNLYNKFLK